MVSAETTPGIRRGGMKENDRGDKFTDDIFDTL
jgi:hypothetical protein